MEPVTDAQTLGQELKKGSNEIIIEGDLAKKVIKIKATGNVAWVIAFGTVAVAVIAVLAAPAGITAGPAGIIAEGVIAGIATTTAASAIAVWGASTAIAAIGIGVGARNPKILQKLREDYIIASESKSNIILKRK